MVYTGELCVQKVRLRLMPITGLTREERRQSIEVRLSISSHHLGQTEYQVYARG